MRMQQSALRNSNNPGRPTLAGGPSLETFESDDSSFSIRIKKAGHEIHSKDLWAIFCVICLALVTVNSLGFIIMEYWIMDDNTADTNHRNIPNSCEIYGLSKNVPMCSWNDRDFISYVTIVIWLTMIMTGLGTEVLFWLMFIKGGWDEDRENQWKLAQFFFPLLGVAFIGLANTHNYFAVPLAVITTWKFGFPETMTKLHVGMHDVDSKFLVRLAAFLSGVGTVLHHSASALYVATVVTGLLPTNRFVLQITLPLLMQHWFVLLKYNYNWAYVFVETILEVWFEWTTFTLIEFLHKSHWTGGLMATVMIFAHWLYFLSGLLGLIAEWLEEDEGSVRKQWLIDDSEIGCSNEGEKLSDNGDSIRQV